jgi:hypothetical protein
MTKTSTSVALSVGSILALGLLAPAAAETTSKKTAAKTETADTVKPAVTADEHLALADTYRKQTAVYREEAAAHRQMLETYKKRVAVPSDARSGIENAWVKKMRLHCEEYIRDADKLAVDTEKFADFHTMRAAELQGK